MARQLDSVCKLCRREGIKLYLKAHRCDTPKCALERRDQPPGMHIRRGKPSEYAVRLREKQKLKRFYGLSEAQFRRFFEIASRSPANTGEVLLSLMERRLDNVVHRLGFQPSRSAARQFITHGHVLVNGRHMDIPSYILKPGDTIEIKVGRKRKSRKGTPRPGAADMVKLNLGDSPPPVPDFLERTSTEPPQGKLVRIPSRDDVDARIKDINEQLIIEVSTR